VFVIRCDRLAHARSTEALLPDRNEYFGSLLAASRVAMHRTRAVANEQNRRVTETWPRKKDKRFFVERQGDRLRPPSPIFLLVERERFEASLLRAPKSFH